METLEALGDEVGALKAGVALAANEFWTGHAEAGLLRLRAMLPRAAGKGVVEQEIRSWIGALTFFGPTPVDEALRIHEELVVGAAAGIYSRDGASVGLRRCSLSRAASTKRARSWPRGRPGSSRSDRAATWRSMHGQVDGRDRTSRREPGPRGRARYRGARMDDGGWGPRLLVHDGRPRGTGVPPDLGQDEEAGRWAEIALRDSVADDYASQGPGRGILARVKARAGNHAEAERLAREAVRDARRD